MEKLRYDFKETRAEITEIIKWFKEHERDAILLRQDYAKGNNPVILERKIPPDSPQNKIPVSYARRMTQMISSYMYRDGLITYTTDNKQYLNDLMEVYDDNHEGLHTEQIGQQVSIQGFGYEHVYFPRSLNGEMNSSMMPRLVKMPAESSIPIYNFDIEPMLTHFIYFYERKDQELEYIEAWNAKGHDIYVRKLGGDGGDIKRIDRKGHGFNRVPFIVYENNEDMIGDFSCVVPLINAYDVLMSDSMNEFDRFAYAYLIIKGLVLSKKDAQQIKYKRLIQGLGKDDIVEFLTKDINSDFVKFMAEWVRAEIHRQSGLPNLDDYKFGTNASGETLGKFIYLMELFTDPKASYFKKGLFDRIKLITENKWNYKPSDIDIVMTRNTPDASQDQADLFTKYAGEISLKTRIEQFADFVDNADKEIAQLEEEKQNAMVNLDNMFGQNNQDEDMEDEEENAQ